MRLCGCGVTVRIFSGSGVGFIPNLASGRLLAPCWSDTRLAGLVRFANPGRHPGICKHLLALLDTLIQRGVVSPQICQPEPPAPTGPPNLRLVRTRHAEDKQLAPLPAVALGPTPSQQRCQEQLETLNFLACPKTKRAAAENWAIRGLKDGVKAPVLQAILSNPPRGFDWSGCAELQLAG